ncbi:uncharacterized protein ATC70_010222 [Mucor velutinosus]|uniref:Uncharacterized protein n=1 Tax=Mucor velutinosus TaxID=708070 RepID=A0AAN7DMR4_9FUNG|nr:hypothetical protein ATC70_010222 [Mucor velutinosus]
MLMPFFNPVDLRIRAASVDPSIRSPNYAPLYANVYKFATPDPLRYKMPPPITTVARDTVSRLTTKSQSSQSGKTYRFNPFKKGTTISSNKVPGPVSSPEPRTLAINRPPSAVTSSRSSTDTTGQAHMPTGPSRHSMIQAPFSVIQFLGSPVVYIYHLFKKDVLASTRYSKEKSKPQQHPLVSEICQVLASGGIHYPDCNSVSADREEMLKETVSTWTVEDKNGVKWRRVSEGKDEGCVFYLQADPTPLKMSATSNKDGTTDISYYTRHTVGKYCPKDENDKEGVRQFYDSLLGYSCKPSTFDIFVNTKVLFNYTLKNVVEFMFLVDAFVLAAKKVFSVYNYRYWSFRVILSLYLAFYLGYTYYTNE